MSAERSGRGGSAVASRSRAPGSSSVLCIEVGVERSAFVCSCRVSATRATPDATGCLSPSPLMGPQNRTTASRYAGPNAVIISATAASAAASVVNSSIRLPVRVLRISQISPFIVFPHLPPPARPRLCRRGGRPHRPRRYRAPRDSPCVASLPSAISCGIPAHPLPSALAPKSRRSPARSCGRAPCAAPRPRRHA